MIKNIILIIIPPLLFSCGRQDPADQLTHLEGYWEIESATLPDGTAKEFAINTTIDYIEVSDSTGIRKKMQPKLDGSYRTSASAETFTAKVENDSLRLYYKTPFDNWRETVLYANDDILKVKNRDGNVYTYTRFRSFKTPE